MQFTVCLEGKQIVQQLSTPYPSALPEISTENQLFRMKVYLILGALCQPFIKRQFFKANEFRDTTCKLHSLVLFHSRSKEGIKMDMQ